MGYVEEAKAKKELAAVEQERLRIDRELATTRTSRQEWKERALTAEDEAKKNKAACDAVIIEVKKKYQKIKTHVLKNFRGALGEFDFPCRSCESPSLSVSFWSSQSASSASPRASAS